MGEPGRCVHRGPHPQRTLGARDTAGLWEGGRSKCARELTHTAKPGVCSHRHAQPRGTETHAQRGKQQPPEPPPLRRRFKRPLRGPPVRGGTRKTPAAPVSASHQDAGGEKCKLIPASWERTSESVHNQINFLTRFPQKLGRQQETAGSHSAGRRRALGTRFPPAPRAWTWASGWTEGPACLGWTSSLAGSPRPVAKE